MSRVDPESLPHVIDSAVVTSLADELTSIGNAVVTSVSAARQRWNGLQGVFDVAGAEGVHFMLNRPEVDATAFATTLSSARNVLWDAASLTLPTLAQRRAELAATIVTVNADYDAAERAWESADAYYWRERRSDPDSSATQRARSARTTAEAERGNAVDDCTRLREDIERFRRDVDNAESMIASQLNGLSGGTEVHGPWGEPVRTAQMYWGFVDAPYPGAPASATVSLSLADHLQRSLADAVVSRIGWLGTAADDDVAAWMAEHPDFASAVGFVDSARAVGLWERLADDSTSRADGAWIAGPLAQLLALAPAAIGNLNGLRVSDRAPFNLAALRRMLADDTLSEKDRRQLAALSKLVDPALGGSATLISLFLDSDGSPRASIGFGDVDEATQITTLSHGIETDLASLDDWSSSASALRSEVDRELLSRGATPGTAVVLFFEWDSGSTFNVWHIDRPDAGAARLAQLLHGFQTGNPGAQLNLGLHSLGTTMGTQAIADNPGLVDNAWLYGSAGISAQTGDQIAAQIADGTLQVHATHAEDDFVAPVGRWPVSAHPVDPRTVPGVTAFSADGGYVGGDGAGVWGDRTEGHNSQESTEWYYLFDGFETGIDGSVVPIWDDASTGYLDPSSQSFKQTVLDLAHAAERVGAGTR